MKYAWKETAYMALILIADDEARIRRLVADFLRRDGHTILEAGDGAEALDIVTERRNELSLVILDVMMPQMDGLSVVREVRKDSQIPVLMLSAKTDDLDKIQGLIQGADDYVTKPFNPLEVMARVRSLLRRSQHEVKNDEPDQIEIGPLIIKKDSHEVTTVNGNSIQLTALEFGILHLLASHPNRVFSADEIFERVWQQESVVSAKTVMVHVSHLRDKIEEATDGEKVIQTVWGVGYKIEAR